MNKSIVVSIQRREKHSLYGKFVKKTSKFIAHDHENSCNKGDTVKIMETRPLSKNKKRRFQYQVRSQHHLIRLKTNKTMKKFDDKKKIMTKNFGIFEIRRKFLEMSRF